MTTTFILAPGEEFIQCPYNLAHQITNAKLVTHLEKCRKAFLKELSAAGQEACMRICRYNAYHHVPEKEIRLHEERCRDALRVVNHLAYHNSEEGERRYEEEHRRRRGDRDRDRSRDRDRRRRSRSRTRSRDRDSKSRHHHHSHRHSSHKSSSSSSSSSKKHSSSSSSRRHSKEEEVKPVTVNEYGLEEEDWEADSKGYEPGYDPEFKLKTELVIYNPQGLTKSERVKFRTEVQQRYETLHQPPPPPPEATMTRVKTEPVDPETWCSETSVDVKPDITKIRIKEEGRTSPLEPGEIDDEDDNEADNYPQAGSTQQNNAPSSSSRTTNGSNGSDYYPKPSTSSSSSAYSRRRNSRTYSRSRHDHSSKSMWEHKMELEKEKLYYPDSDENEGNDPYV